jgi:hydroxypyruvate isomerase
MTRAGWTTPFSAPLSFPGLETPYFHAVADPHPVVQIEEAWRHGFTGVFDSQLTRRPVDIQKAMGQALARRGMEIGSVTVGPLHLQAPVWTDPAPGTRALLAEAMEAALAACGRTGARHLTVLTARDRDRPFGVQFDAFAEALAVWARRAEAEGVCLCIEAASAQRAPAALIRRTVDARNLVRQVNSPALRMVFDVAHCALTEGDVIANMLWALPDIAVIQLSDLPERLEPGSGELNLERLIGRALDAGYAGRFELEHLFSTPGTAGLALALDRLGRIDAAVSRREER